MRLLLAVLCLLLVCQARAVNWCGQVGVEAVLHDGRAHVISGSWRGFTGEADDNIDVYHYMVVDEDHPILKSFNKNSRCIVGSGRTDLGQWQDVGVQRRIDQHSLRKTLVANQNYHLLVRATDHAGDTIISKSREFQVEERLITGLTGCSLENYCRAGRAIVGDVLTEQFGPPVFFVPGEGGDDDDDDGLSSVDKAGIIIGAIAGGIILLALLLIAFGGRGGWSKGFQDVGIAGTVEDDPSGPREKLTTQDQNTNVVIQYPDTGLNLDQKVEMTPVAATSTAQDGVRPTLTGVLDAKTPSDRDYRTQL